MPAATQPWGGLVGGIVRVVAPPPFLVAVSRVSGAINLSWLGVCHV